MKNSLYQDGLTTKVPCKVCGKEFEGEKGLRIHQGKTNCGKSASPEVNCVSPDSEPEVLPCQDENHSATVHQHASREEQILHKLGRKPPIRWPKMNELPKWAAYETEVISELSKFPMSIMSRINELETVMYEKGKEMFGVYERVPNPRNRRQRKSDQLRTQVRHLRRAFRKAEPGSDDQNAIKPRG